MSVSQSPTITDVTNRVASGLLDSGAVQIAKDIVAGYTGDYLFFPVSDHSYALILGDYTFIQGSAIGLEDVYFASDFDWYLIELTATSSTVSISESGSQYGSMWGANIAGSYNGSYSGTFVLPERQFSYAVYYYHDQDGVTIQNPNNYVCFGSAATLPKLHEGSVFYDYATLCLLGVGFCFVLFASIFKRVKS